MADVDYDDFDAGYPAGWPEQAAASGRLARIIHLSGAACSIALVAGLAIWGYKLAVRDVNGVPVIRAMEGPMRIAPENPGGEVADHQGLAVNTVAALGTAAPPPDRLVLAPRPLELQAEDAAGLSAMPAAASAPVPAAPGLPDLAAAPSVPAVPEAPVEENLGPDPDAVAQALAEALAGTEVAAAEPVATVIRPRPRPGSALPQPSADASAAALAGDAATATAPIAELDPASIAIGTRLVQLGAFDTPELARAEWMKLAGQFGDLMASKSMVVQAAESGGRSFFRLRAHGFDTETDARGFCSTLLQQNASCIPVEQR